MSGFPLAFAEPLMLTALIALPALWWLLRLMPPKPRRIEFPPTQILFDIAPKEETPARTPWWLTALRLLLAGILILAAAGPILNPQDGAGTADGPVALLIDDGWSAAASWDKRLKTADDIIAQAQTNRRAVALIPMSDATRAISLMPAGDARSALQQLTPQPYTVSREKILPQLTRFLSREARAQLIWLSDGVDDGGGEAFTAQLAPLIKDRGITIFDNGIASAIGLGAPANDAEAMSVKVMRAQNGVPQAGIVRALDQKGTPLGESPFALNPDHVETSATFALPTEIRNDIARLEIAGMRSAGAVQLLDKRWRRRAVGIASGAANDNAQPLLAPAYYLTRALAPFADIRPMPRGSMAAALDDFLTQKLPMIALADVGTLPPETEERLSEWIAQGGVLVRFAGPRLAASNDDLVPVKLRRGGRNLGGALTWEKPQPLATFSADGPFASLPVPTDVTVSRQVLAEPDEGLSRRTWASLADGTPLVTGERRGKGVIALFHVSADTRWSDLPLSGAFVEMLRRILDYASYVQPGAGDTGAKSNETAPPLRLIDGFGLFVPPSASVKPLPVTFAAAADADHPPGLYGTPDSPIAVNTLTAGTRLKPLDVASLNMTRRAYHSAEPQDLRGLLLTLTFILFALDALIVALIGGRLKGLVTRRMRSAAALIALATAMSLLAPAFATAQETPPDKTNPAKLLAHTRLAYILTGDSEIDAITRAGLNSLTIFLAQRTALEAGDPVGLDPARDELSFYPLIYWPITPATPAPDRATRDKLDAYMKQGGTLLFDTRDAVEQLPSPGTDSPSPATRALRNVLATLDIPELEPVPRDHVLSKTFYLLRDFPGRFTSGQMWVETLPRNNDDDQRERPARGGDGVSPIIITSNDLAGAWATRPDGQPMLPLQPDEPRQREFAFRVGANIVMYTLTGNYKADQVHVPALIERLGQ